ncbi:hypothetical protein C8J56DRAFT_929244 [Mycena floridula]|nr:hypothetical protein C8J56DRAFT_929244 [Mycena floridula]
MALDTSVDFIFFCTLSPSVLEIWPRAWTLIQTNRRTTNLVTTGRRPACQEEVDPQILEALNSEDRLFVLKLGEQMESLINDRRARIELTPATSYQRLLVHRCSAYYRLLIEKDPPTKSITVLPTPDCYIPARRLANLVPLETAARPTFKIMRRNMDRTKPTSQTGSVTDEDADLSDVEPSEAGSLGGRTTKKHWTLEERFAAYQRARDRIFQNDDKKDKQMTTSLASLSIDSTSTQAGGSSVGDLDETSSVTAESEQSGPSMGRENKDNRRSGSSSGQPSTSRILRPSAPVFSSSGSASSRDSRSSSPSFTYATLYEPAAPQAPPFDPNTGQPFAPAQYMYHYPPGQPLNSQFVPQYGYYLYPFPGQPTTDPVSPTSATEMYPPMHYGPYLWPQAQHPQAMSAPNLARQGTYTSPSVAEVVGPRFRNVRRLSNNRVEKGSVTSRTSSNWDNVSTAATAGSSSTSSPRRRTYISTSSSSQHPLPARPDWAVGLKPIGFERRPAKAAELYV